MHKSQKDWPFAWNEYLAETNNQRKSFQKQEVYFSFLWSQNLSPLAFSLLVFNGVKEWMEVFFFDRWDWNKLLTKKLKLGMQQHNKDDELCM